MTRSPTTGFVQSIQDRLRNAAESQGRPYVELLELYAIERFLHRLGRSPQRERFVLKGALLLRQWLGAHSRPTRDVDLLGPIDLDADALHGLLADVLQLPRALTFDGATLAESIHRTFARRQTIIPAARLEGLSDHFAAEPLHATRWHAFLAKGKLEVPDREFLDIVVAIRQFAEPVLDAGREGTSFTASWPPDGPWQ